MLEFLSCLYTIAHVCELNSRVSVTRRPPLLPPRPSGLLFFLEPSFHRSPPISYTRLTHVRLFKKNPV